MSAQPVSVGIDFGTTNSSIAVLSDRNTSDFELLSFPSTQGPTQSYRSVLYLEQHNQAGRAQLKSFTGPAAIDHYLHPESPGRLIQSLKSYLPSRSLTGTEVFGRRYSLENLIARILTDLRLVLEAHLGQPVRRATVGRPVRFVSSETAEDDSFALSRLEASFKEAGFDSVSFEYEPVAAAYAYETTLTRDELILIGDFGGGVPATSLCFMSAPASAPAVARRVIYSATLGWAWPEMLSTRASFASSFRPSLAPILLSAPSRMPRIGLRQSFLRFPHGSTLTSNAGITSRS